MDHPQIAMDQSKYPGAQILDVGFGDGRNWPLLHNVGFNIFAIDITDQIVQLGHLRAKQLGIEVTLKVGTNSEIPFEDDVFDYILASNSCYYIDEGTTFKDTLQEYSRVLKPNGLLIASLPEIGGSICEGGIDRGDGYVEIRNDPWDLRNGYVFRSFRSEEEVHLGLQPFFGCRAIGLCRENYYGVRIHLFTVVAQNTRVC